MRGGYKEYTTSRNESILYDFGEPISGVALEALQLAIEKTGKKSTDLKNRY